jgi:prophage DNA circulation protein
MEPLGRAAYRGLEFDARSISVTVGRRRVFAEFPGIDGKSSEDLGKAARIYKIEAIFSGDLYLTNYRRMLSFAEDSLSGEYRHPDGTIIWATLSEPAEFAIQAGAVSVPLTFTEELDVRFEPLIDPNAISRVSDARTAAKAAALSAWDQAAKPLETVNAAITGVKSALEIGRKQAAEAALLLTKFQTTVADIINIPAQVFEDLQDLYTAITDFSILKDAIWQYHDMQLGVFSSWASITDEAAQAEARNAFELNLFLATLTVASTAEAVESATYTALDDAQSAVDVIGDEIDALAPYTTHVVMISLLDTLSAIQTSVLETAQRLPRLQDFIPWRIMSCHEIALHLYGDASRSAEIVSRNRVQHPGFVSPQTTLKVLEV